MNMRLLVLMIISLLASDIVSAQSTLIGKVLSEKDSLPIEGVIVTVNGISSTTSNAEGLFSIDVLKAKVGKISFRHVGYQSVDSILTTPPERAITVFLKEALTVLDEVEVVSTGYQKIPKERSTGSFAIIDKKLFNQQVGPDILSRLPVVTNGMVVNNGRAGTPQIMIRGLSTIRGPKEPLIVVDNFPYEGDISNINPNIVESITVLKDASASSIWGAKAANGVIVITTKSGRFNELFGLYFNSNLTITAEPDLGSIPQMSTSDFIDVEMGLFKNGFYSSQINSTNKPVISPVVDLLDKAQRGIITEEKAQQEIDQLRSVDIRDELLSYMYKPSINQQYFLAAHGGSKKFSWMTSLGYDHNKDDLGAVYQRMNIRFKNTFQPFRQLTLVTNLYYTQTWQNSGRYGYNDIGMKGSSFVPYMKIADGNGNPLAVPRNRNQSYIDTAGNGKLLDWHYYPLTDWRHQTSHNNGTNILASTKLDYQIMKGFHALINYQYERQSRLNTSLSDKESYTARDYVNSFTQLVDGIAVYAVPVGGILDKSSGYLTSNNLRGQLSFDNTYNKSNINIIIGSEIRSKVDKSFQTRFYGYDKNNLSTGSVDYTHSYPSYIGGGSAYIYNAKALSSTNTRFVSEFANAAYTYDNRYIFSVSGRRDASNLFGLKTNDQWNPFWSAGVAWKVSNESFYNLDFAPYVTFRATYGFSGNIDPSMVAVNTILYQSSVSTYTGLRTAQFNNYYNPDLRWETSKMLNLAVDFRILNDRLSGAIEFYHKKGENLFGTAPTDYSTGVPPSILRNVASLEGSGWDIELKSLNINRGFKWKTILNFSIYKDKIVDYLISRTRARDYISTSTPPISGVKGDPVYSIYAYKWAGLDPKTGEARGYLNGEVSKDYSKITGTGTTVDDLLFFGSAIPTKFGSLINEFFYKNVSLQIGINFKFGYWFRRSSLNYTTMFNDWYGHADYALRWQKTGDENHTNVPANLYTTNSQRDAFYSGSSVLVEKGNHIRLKYINLSYTPPNLFHSKSMLKDLQIFFNVNNVGLLWSANKSGIDPDYSIGFGSFAPSTSYSIGIRTNL